MRILIISLSVAAVARVTVQGKQDSHHVVKRQDTTCQWKENASKVRFCVCV
jgi:hypothetical protein